MSFNNNVANSNNKTALIAGSALAVLCLCSVSFMMMGGSSDDDKTTPTAEKTTPTTEKTTPTAEKTTPTAEKTTPTAEKTTPTAEKTTPTAEKTTPTVRKAVEPKRQSTPPSQPSVDIGKFEKFTSKKNNSPMNNIFGLSNIDVKCDKGGGVLNRFNVEISPSGRDAHYKYACLNNMDAKVVSNKRTRINDSGRGNVIYLDRHKVDCGIKPITGFKLTDLASRRKIRYDYTCGESDKIKKPETCTARKSLWSNRPVNRLTDLSQIKANCMSNEYMSNFHLKHDGRGRRFRYEYTCCKK
jgi:hypothetical protein